MRLLRGLFLIVISLTAFIPAMTFAQDPVKPPKVRKGADILDRIDFGGYLGAQFGTVTLIDVSPLASYRVTDNFHAGLGLTYQYYKINYSGPTPDYSTSSYGGSVFARYFIWQDLFAHVEYAPLYVTYYDYFYDNTGYYSYRVKGATWVHDLMVGGGYRQWLGERSFLSLMILFNVNETYYSPYRNPIIRIGFGVGL